MGSKGTRSLKFLFLNMTGQRIIDEFTSLVNPECEIPYFITGLTGIDNALVRNAPTIAEIAPTILSFTEGTIFVAHSVNFDYNVIKNEFKELGIIFCAQEIMHSTFITNRIPRIQVIQPGKTLFYTWYSPGEQAQSTWRCPCHRAVIPKNSKHS